MKIFIDEVKDFDVHAAVNDYMTINNDYPSIPTKIAGKVLPQLEFATKVSREYIQNLLY